MSWSGDSYRRPAEIPHRERRRIGEQSKHRNQTYIERKVISISMARNISPLDLLLDIHNYLKNRCINLVMLLLTLDQPLVETSHGLY